MTTQTLHLHLKVLSPLHVGCGEVYEPTSFVVKQKEDVLVSFNALHFLAGLDEKLLGEFSAICKEGKVASLLKVYKFIDRHAQNMEGREVQLAPALTAHYQKVLGLPGDKIQKELNQFSLARTAFNALDGSVYIPGSAIKGSIRTAVLNLRQGTEKLPKQQKTGDLENGLLGGNFEYSPFSRLKVSDFHPVNTAGRRIVYAVDKKKKPGKFEASAPYQIVEVIEPGAIFAGTVSLLPPRDSRVSPQKALTLEEVQSALRIFYTKEFDREKGEAAATLSARYPTLPNDALPLRVGRHSGAESVTVEGQRQIRILQGKGTPAKTLDHATTIWFAAENKEGGGQLRPFGWAALQAIGPEEIEADQAFLRDREAQGREERQAALVRRTERLAEIRQDAERKAKEEAERLRREAERQAAEEAEQRRLEAERQAREEEERRHPWKSWLLELDGVKDWDRISELVFTNPEAATWRGEADVAEKVAAVCAKLRDARRKEWTAEQDAACAAWLQPAGITWEPMSGQECLIWRLKDYGAYLNLKLADLADLTLPEAKALRGKFKEWGFDGKKAKEDKKKLWKALDAHIKALGQQQA